MPGLFNRRPEPERKLIAEIENTEFKKQSIIAPLTSEIRQAQNKIDGLLLKIGQSVYEAHVSGAGINATDLGEQFDAIAREKAIIAEKEAKIGEFTSRYDEELTMLRANLSQMTGQGIPMATKGSADGASGGKAFCGNCGSQYNVGSDAFCGTCGNKLS